MALREMITRLRSVASDIGPREAALDRSPKVLCATDLWPRSKGAVWRAHAIATALGGDLLLLHVIDAAPSPRVNRRRGARARFILDAQARNLARSANGAQVAVRDGSPHKTIADVAIEWDADLIVLGPYRRRFGDGFRGATAERVIRRAGRPVLVVNSNGSGPYEHVLLTSDLSHLFTGIADVAKKLGLLEGSRTCVVHTRRQTRAMLYMAGIGDSDVGIYRRSLRPLAADEIKSRLTDAGLSSARFSILSLQTSPFRGIGEIAERMKSDLVVVGSSRSPLLKRVFVGSVVSEVLRGIKRDALLISPAAVLRARGLASRRSGAPELTE